MALTRLAAFPTGSILTSLQLTSEFDNIYNNALTLISPLTGNLDFNNKSLLNLARGSAAAPSLYFNADSGTGLYSAAANQVGWSVAGVAVANFTAAAAGPHVIGSGTTNSRYALLQTGTITLSGATQEAGFASDQALTNASGVNLFGAFFNQTLTNVAGATTTMAWLTLNPSALTITAGSVTNSAGLYITGAPSGATNNYAIWVAGGTCRVSSTGSSAPLQLDATGGTNGSAQWLIQADGGVGGLLLPALAFYDRNGAAYRMLLTNSGILLVGSASSSGLGAGGLGISGDLRLGTALVALGPGASATLGTIGGSGPATAGQNTWLKLIDSGGATFWVPAWK